MAALYIIISKATLIDYFQLSDTMFETPEQFDTFKEIMKENFIEVDFR
ncbi:MAG: hypothetical protein ACQERS_02315 [Bacteroidota bacterium]